MRLDWLRHFPRAHQAELGRILQQKDEWIGQEKKGFLRYRKPMEAVAHLRASSCAFTSDVVRIGSASDLSPQEQQQVGDVLRAFMPWRKGPYSVFGIDIDAEWRSERKWMRLVPELPDLNNKIVGDIGCNNGYYMFRMAAYKPAYVLGFEPLPQHYFTFKMLNGFAQQANLGVELLRIEDLPLFPSSFDVLFCLGILYHRPSPIKALQELFEALKPGGVLMVESQAIPGEDPVALFPERTYAKAPGVWFVPTAVCLSNWLRRTGFAAIRCFCTHPMTSLEQRRTEWMRFESYENFIDKDDPSRTMESYPAPIRVFFRAEKPL